MSGTALTELVLARTRARGEEFEPASAARPGFRGERIGWDPEATLIYAEGFATSIRQLLAEVERLRSAQAASSGPAPDLAHPHSCTPGQRVAGCSEPTGRERI